MDRNGRVFRDFPLKVDDRTEPAGEKFLFFYIYLAEGLKTRPIKLRKLFL